MSFQCRRLNHMKPLCLKLRSSVAPTDGQGRDPNNKRESLGFVGVRRQSRYLCRRGGLGTPQPPFVADPGAEGEGALERGGGQKCTKRKAAK